MGVPGVSFQMGVRGLISVNLGVLDMKKFDNHWAMSWPVVCFLSIIPVWSITLHCVNNLIKIMSHL